MKFEKLTLADRVYDMRTLLDFELGLDFFKMKAIRQYSYVKDVFPDLKHSHIEMLVNELNLQRSAGTLFGRYLAISQPLRNVTLGYMKMHSMADLYRMYFEEQTHIAKVSPKVPSILNFIRNCQAIDVLPAQVGLEEAQALHGIHNLLSNPTLSVFERNQIMFDMGNDCIGATFSLNNEK